MVTIKEAGKAKLVGYDFILPSHKSFNKRLPKLMYPKVYGDWNVALTNVRVDDIFEVMEMTIPDFLNIDIYASKDIIEIVRLQGLQIEVTTVTLIDKVRAVVSESGLLVQNNVVQNLYSRTRGDLEMVKDIVEALLNKFGTKTVITVRNLDTVSLNQTITYPSDLVAAILDLPSKFKRDVYGIAQKLIRQYGELIAFYATRKYLNDLLEESIVYMKTNKTENYYVKNVLGYDIARACVIFNTESRNSLLVAISRLEGIK